MSYAVKEIFLTLQGEGFHAGRVAVFCRFAGCNLWSGREEDRAEAVCRFCDTDFVRADAGKFDRPEALAAAIAALWPAGERRFVVFTGGEPLLQLDGPLIEAMHRAGFEIAVETNGTIAAPPGIDWLCVSPKAGSEWIQRQGDELKLVMPQAGFDLEALARLPFFLAGDGWPRSGGQSARGGGALSAPSGLAAFRPDPQASGDPLKFHWPRCGAVRILTDLRRFQS